MLPILSTAWGLLTSRLAGPIAAGVALALGLALAVQAFHLASARKDASSLRAQIEAPNTGFRDRLAACHANAVTLEGQLSDQTAKVREQAAAQNAKLAEAARLAAQAEAGRKRTQALSDQIAAYRTPAGADVCADLKAADAAVLETLR